MKTLSNELITEQKKSIRRPALQVNVTTYDKPGAPAALQWDLFGWTNLYTTGGISPTFHGVAIPQDKSLNRVRVTGGHCYHQRVTSPEPGANFVAAWTDLGAVTANSVAISASLAGPEVIIFACVGASFYISYIRSTDNGASWGSWTQILTGYRGDGLLAACHKSANEMGLVFASAATGYIQMLTRDSGLTWAYKSVQPQLLFSVNAAIYFDGDYNIVTQVSVSGTTRLARLVYGQGYRVTTDSWSNIDYLSMSGAKVALADLLSQYYQTAYYPPDYDSVLIRFSPLPQPQPPLRTFTVSSYIPPVFGTWETVPVVTSARASDNLDLDAPFICKPAGQPPVMSFIRIGERWTYRLKPGSDFYDMQWESAHKYQASTPYGLALACDGTYIWGTRSNEVWRMLVPGLLNIPQLMVVGGPVGNASIPQEDIIKVQQDVGYRKSGSLILELDNSDGTYSGLPTIAIRRGAYLNFKYGYNAASGILLNPGESYCIEDWTFNRVANQVSVILHCIDAWGMLERFRVPSPAEVNFCSNQYSVYDLIEKFVLAIGGSLYYVSRSSNITSLYPRMRFSPGESGAGAMRRLLDLVPDVIRFDSFNGYIINPLSTDINQYAFHYS